MYVLNLLKALGNDQYLLRNVPSQVYFESVGIESLN